MTITRTELIDKIRTEVSDGKCSMLIASKFFISIKETEDIMEGIKKESNFRQDDFLRNDPAS